MDKGLLRTGECKRREVRSGQRLRRYRRREASIKEKAEVVGSEVTVGRIKAADQVEIRQQLG